MTLVISIATVTIIAIVAVIINRFPLIINDVPPPPLTINNPVAHFFVIRGAY